MKCKADIVAAIAVLVWLAIAWEFRDHLSTLSVPVTIVAAIAAVAFVCHRFGRWFEAEATIALASLMAVIPFCFATFGGV